MWAERLSLPSVIAPARPCAPSLRGRGPTASRPASGRRTSPRDPRRRRRRPRFFQPPFPIPSNRGPPESRNGRTDIPVPERRVSNAPRSSGSRRRPKSIPPPPAPQSFAPLTRRRNRRSGKSSSTAAVDTPEASVLRIAHSAATAAPVLGVRRGDRLPCVPRRGGDPPELPQHHGVAVDRTADHPPVHVRRVVRQPRVGEEGVVPQHRPRPPPRGSRRTSTRPGENRIPWMPPRSAARWSCRPVRLFRWAASISIAAPAISSRRHGAPVSLPAASSGRPAGRTTRRSRSRPALRCTPGSRRRTPQGNA